MMNLKEKGQKLVTLLALVVLTLAVGCGQQEVITDFSVNPYNDENGDVKIDVSTGLNLQNIILPSLSLPINLPEQDMEIGVFSMQAAGAGSIISFSLNLSEVAKIQAAQATLPNGNLIPLIADNPVITIPVNNRDGEEQARVYVLIANETLAVGFDVSIGGLDGVGSAVGSAVSLFPGYTVGNADLSAILSAGMYVSPNAGENGIGLFADVSNLVDEVFFLQLGSEMSAGNKSLRSSIDPELEYGSIEPRSRRARRRLNRELVSLNERGAELEL